MPENVSNIVIICLVAGIGILALVGLLVKVIKRKRASVQTVPAVIVDKHKTQVFSKYAGNGKQEKYVVVFSAGGKKLSFYVSEFSYRGYRVEEKGMLTYKGDQLIRFQ